jgi:hypothetical protein
MKQKYRASADNIVVGVFSSTTAAKKALSRKVLIDLGGRFANGWVDRINDDGTTTCVWQRILAGGEIGWWCNE